MKQISKILFITLALSLTFTKSEVTESLKFLSDSLSNIESNMSELLSHSGEILSVIQENITSDFISKECKDELVSMKSVIDAITQAHGTDEMIFYAAKDVVNHFPGLKANCKIPLPTIDTSKWDLEKFKKYKCALEVVTFATTAGACIDGVFISCAKALKSLVTLGKCIKDIL